MKVEKKLPCGHTKTTDCYRPEENIRCQAACGVRLACGHLCGNACGSCARGRLKLHACGESCKRTLVCGHQCSDKCSSTCSRCKKTECMTSCSHSVCEKECGEPCTQCIEPCDWECEHHTCRLKCYEPCRRSRCDRRCGETLKCGHRCRGVCGEPKCPDCLECRPEEEKVFDLSMGDYVSLGDMEEDDTVVQLACGHLFTTESLDSYILMKEETMRVQHFTCPLCNQPILPAHVGRYRRETNEVAIAMNKVKEKQQDQDNEFKRVKVSLSTQLRNSERGWSSLRQQFGLMLNVAPPQTNSEKWIALAFGHLRDRVNEVKSIPDLDTLKLQVDFFLWVTTYRNLFDVVDIEEVVSQEITKEAFTHFMRCFKVKALLKRLANVIDEANGAIQAHETHWKNVSGLLDTLNRRSTSAVQDSELLLDEELVNWESEVAKVERKFTGSASTTMIMKIASKAVGYGAGHWYQCPNGHPYVIADCGGAVIESKCPDCDAVIGGAGHRTRDDNVFAGGRLDAAASPAWPQ
ncbi:hypothetical protein DIPPA_32291 [Diplonema papillatum]|nr:hypothetical protein DIPPA_32291 [Diplonema papillatum]